MNTKNTNTKIQKAMRPEASKTVASLICFLGSRYAIDIRRIATDIVPRILYHPVYIGSKGVLVGVLAKK